MINVMICKSLNFDYFRLNERGKALVEKRIKTRKCPTMVPFKTKIVP